ncbi:hypothetical protein ACWCPM_07855 [Streptomyces sp. NPDC002309]
MLATTHLAEDLIDFAQIGQDLVSEVPLLDQPAGHAECMIEIQGYLVWDHTVLHQPGILGRSVSSHHQQRLDQQASTERRTRILHITIVARAIAQRRIGCSPTLHVYPYAAEHFPKQADARLPGRLRQRPHLREQDSAWQTPSGRIPAAIGPRRDSLAPEPPGRLGRERPDPAQGRAGQLPP